MSWNDNVISLNLLCTIDHWGPGPAVRLLASRPFVRRKRWKVIQPVQELRVVSISSPCCFTPGLPLKSVATQFFTMMGCGTDLLLRPKSPPLTRLEPAPHPIVRVQSLFKALNMGPRHMSWFNSIIYPKSNQITLWLMEPRGSIPH